jgi:hypothetical protein
MVNSGAEDDDWEDGFRDEEESVEGEDDVEEVETSGSRASVKPILCLPERTEVDTDWTHRDGTEPVSGRNKLTCEDMATVRKRKDLMWTEVAKPDGWDKLAAYSTSTVHEPVGSASSHDTDARCRRHVTIRTDRAGLCTRDDHSGRHPDLLSLLCPRGDCPP